MISCDLALMGDVLLPEGRCDDGLVLVCEGVIRYAGPRSGAPPFGAAQELTGDLLAPGLVDIHVHGGGGVDAADGLEEALREMSAVHLRRGTTSLVPTVLASSPERTCRALEAIRDLTGVGNRRSDLVAGGAAATILGAHLEGPFLNPERAGAQPREHLRAPDPGLLRELLAAAGGTLKLITLAPELPGALELVETLAGLDEGVTVAMGHSAATFDEALAAVDAGARHATHLWNAMAPLHHREPGLVGAALTDPRVTVEVIADGVHLHPAAVDLAWRARGPARLALVTDCIAALGAPEGGARLGDQPVTVDSGGAARLPGGALAGSVLTMDRAVSGLVTMSGATAAEALVAASVVPAAIVGAEAVAGAIRQGALADLVVIGEPEASLVAVVKDGAVVRSREES